MQIHTGFICWTFLHCVTSNVFSNCLYGCKVTLVFLVYFFSPRCIFMMMVVWRNFLRETQKSSWFDFCSLVEGSVFSCGSSNIQPKKVQNYTNCIFVTFLHCAFSNQIARMGGCIATLLAFLWLFSTVHHQMFLQCTWPRAFIVALVAFSPRCIFKCILISLAREDA